MEFNYVANRTDEDVIKVIQAIQAEYRSQRAVPISATTIAERLGCTSRTVQNAVKRLEEKGRIRISSEKGKPTRYEVVEN